MTKNKCIRILCNGMIFLGRCRGVVKLEDVWRQTFSIVVFYHCLQVSEMEVNGQFESVCESVFSELESQAVEALDLPMPGCFRMRSHSYVRAIEKGCSQDDECVSLRSSSPPRTTTTVRTIQSSTGEWHPQRDPMSPPAGLSTQVVTIPMFLATIKQ